MICNRERRFFELSVFSIMVYVPRFSQPYSHVLVECDHNAHFLVHRTFASMPLYAQFSAQAFHKEGSLAVASSLMHIVPSTAFKPSTWVRPSAASPM